jgi:hypothetical protein
VTITAMAIAAGLGARRVHRHSGPEMTSSEAGTAARAARGATFAPLSASARSLSISMSAASADVRQSRTFLFAPMRGEQMGETWGCSGKEAAKAAAEALPILSNRRLPTDRSSPYSWSRGHRQEARIVGSPVACTAVSTFSKVDRRRRVVGRQIQCVVATSIVDGEDGGHCLPVSHIRFACLPDRSSCRLESRSASSDSQVAFLKIERDWERH